MSFRDLRNFTEMMRALGYPRLISMENFRNPNFPLVAEIIVWLVERIAPNSSISPEIAEEADRVHLIRTSAQILVLKAGLKLNTKRLYQADGYAVKELLKVAQLLYNSLKAKESNAVEEAGTSVLDTVLKVQLAQQAREKVAEITAVGATLFDLLGKEPELREMRNNRAARPLEIPQVEAAIKESIKEISKEIAKTKELINNVASNEASLDSKIEKKKSDIERHNKRLQALKKMRPAFMDEFESVEEKLKILYEEYVVKSRNVNYLESVLEQVQQTENERRKLKQASARQILEEIRSAQPTKINDDVPEEKNNNRSIQNRVSAPKGTRKNFGSMAGGIEDTDDDDDDDSDLLLDGDITDDDDDDPKSFKDISEDDF